MLSLITVTTQATTSLPECICTLCSARKTAGAVVSNVQAMLSTVYISILATVMLGTCNIRSGSLTTLAFNVVLVEG